MISPTKQGIRGIDKHGSGEFRASRGPGKLHRGVDFICIPGKDVFAPISGRIIREARPYADGEFSGIVIENTQITIKMFYVLPFRFLIGKKVGVGESVGQAQDIGKKYPGIIPHIHLEVDMIDPAILLGI